MQPPSVLHLKYPDAQVGDGVLAVVVVVVVTVVVRIGLRFTYV